MSEAPDAELVAEAEAVGVTRILTVGIDGASCREALASAEAFPQVHAAIGRHPNGAKGFDDADLAELRALAAHERCRAIGETGKPIVIHTRAAEDETIAMLRGAEGLAVILHCFSMPDRLDECLAQGWWISFAGNVTYPSAGDLAEAAARVPAERLLVETDAPFLAPQPVRGKPNRPAYVTHTARFVAQARGVSYEELEATVDDNAARLFGW
jgi:TatD DNase family protein